MGDEFIVAGTPSDSSGSLHYIPKKRSHKKMKCVICEKDGHRHNDFSKVWACSHGWACHTPCAEHNKLLFCPRCNSAISRPLVFKTTATPIPSTPELQHPYCIPCKIALEDVALHLQEEHGLKHLAHDIKRLEENIKQAREWEIELRNAQELMDRSVQLYIRY
jgi:hypothetical protein